MQGNYLCNGDIFPHKLSNYKERQTCWIFLRLCSLLLSNLFMIYEGRSIQLKNDKENVTCLKSASRDKLESLKYTESEYRISLEWCYNTYTHQKCKNCHAKYLILTNSKKHFVKLVVLCPFTHKNWVSRKCSHLFTWLSKSVLKMDGGLLFSPSISLFSAKLV